MNVFPSESDSRGDRGEQSDDLLFQIIAEYLAAAEAGPAGRALAGAPVFVLGNSGTLAAFVIPEPGRPPGTSSYHQPFGHYDLMGVGGDGRGVWTVVRGPNGSRGAGLPAGVGSFELRGFEEGRGARQLTIAYPLREMTRDHIESWFEGWKRAPIIRFWLDRGVFPSMAAIREAAVGALEIPQYLPPVSNAGSGLKDRGILVTDGGILLEEWHDREPGDARWMVVDPERGLVAYLTVPAPYRLMDLSARWAWCVRIDEFDRPILARFRVIRQQGR